MKLETRFQFMERLLSKVHIPLHFSVGVNKKWFTLFTLLISRASNRIVLVVLGLSLGYNYKTGKLRRNRRPVK